MHSACLLHASVELSTLQTVSSATSAQASVSCVLQLDQTFVTGNRSLKHQKALCTQHPCFRHSKKISIL